MSNPQVEDLYVKPLMRYGLRLYWICRKIEGKYIPLTDVHAPTGYGFTSKSKAERIARELERERSAS